MTKKKKIKWVYVYLVIDGYDNQVVFVFSSRKKAESYLENNDFEKDKKYPSSWNKKGSDLEDPDNYSHFLEQRKIL